ncbi:MAG: M23 family metallopeptidase [Bacteroidales bacterium]|nr:M23 family metallopeptidase [Bacteroidales bacterium]
MPKNKYIINYENLTFEKIERSFKSYFFRVLSLVLYGFFMALLGIIVFYNFFDSPKEKILKRELELTALKYEELNSKINEMEKVLKDIQYRDDNIYRTIFEIEPLSESIRKGGIGGNLNYDDFENLTYSDLIITTIKRTEELAKKIYIQTKSFDEIVEIAKNKELWLRSIPAIIPIHSKDQYKIVSHFGMRYDPIFKNLLEMHTGIDFSCSAGTPVYATGDGKVVIAEYNIQGYGNQVLIDHGFSYQTRYAHLSKIKVKPGQNVKRGEIIGFVGNTGKSIGPHLHYEVIKNGKPLNPIHFFFLDLTPSQYNELIELSKQEGGISLD